MLQFYELFIYFSELSLFSGLFIWQLRTTINFQSSGSKSVFGHLRSTHQINISKHLRVLVILKNQLFMLWCKSNYCCVFFSFFILFTNWNSQDLCILLPTFIPCSITTRVRWFANWQTAQAHRTILTIVGWKEFRGLKKNAFGKCVKSESIGSQGLSSSLRFEKCRRGGQGNYNFLLVTSCKTGIIWSIWSYCGI